jgi:hypothetical protein
MTVMVIVRTRPDAAGAESVYSKQPHQNIGHLGFRENGVMLLVVINDKQP